MTKKHPFRFALGCSGTETGTEWGDVARKAEDYGFSTLSLGEHLQMKFSPLTALATAAAVTTTLRVGTLVFANDFRHPAMLAKEVATLDVLSAGRVEFGLGTGWMASDYSGLGIPMDPPGVRVNRFEEAIQIIKGLFGPEPVTFAGDHYHINDLNGLPKPHQQPHPPLLIGGGGKRMLAIAAREADIVSIDTTHTKAGGIDFTSVTAEAYEQKAQWIQKKAGDRLADPELNTLVWAVMITKDKQVALEKVVEMAKQAKQDLGGVSPEALLESPKLLIGPEEEIIETLQARRERYGISYYTFMGEHHLETVKPILAHLAGT